MYCQLIPAMGLLGFGGLGEMVVGWRCVWHGATWDSFVPTLVFHFSGGADMALPPENYWAPIDKSTACMAIFEAFEISIIGNFQQQNMHLLFDIGKGQLSFQTANCSTL